MFQIGLSLAQAPVSRAASSAPDAHVFVVAGDSVASGRAAETDAEVFPAGARHWAASNAWEPVGSRLHHGPWETGAVARPDASANFGWARAFANAYQAANPGVILHLIGVARAGAGFANGLWTPGGAAYQAALGRINAALSAAPANAVLKGILWHQGGADAQDPAARATYEAALTGLVASLRADVVGAGPSTPFVIGGHFPLSAQYHADIQSVCQSRPNRIAHTGYADPSTPTEATLFDGVHPDAAANQRLGQSYHLALLQAAANPSVASTGAITTGAIGHYPLPRALVATVTGVALGSPASDRLLVVAVTARSDTAIRPLSVSVGGLRMTRAGAPETGVNHCGATLYYGRVPDGTAATVEVAFDALNYNGQAAISVLPVYGARLHPASAKGFAIARSDSGTTTLSAPISAEPGEFVYAFATGISNALAAAVVNLPQTLSSLAGNAKYGIYSAAGLSATSGPMTVTFNFDMNLVRATLAAIVLKPS
ncbi:sialate O-acetylesterase [Albidovulum sediminis]|uniref:Sialate O-acetylesterase n=1 Tax=Albidovulum sediminis TaxID=3066345 RepID=A0ABT2NQ53_9RHOB|nr:sialate O-acetylesterase [Defluviimonas sediminis]MCT8331075.1 sialate O-acetylesterase [Defluviimonas sediminis]